MPSNSFFTTAKARAGRFAEPPLRWAFAALEALVSARGMALGFLAAAAVLSVSSWIHPPLSPDLRGHRLVFGGAWPFHTDEASKLLDGSHPRMPATIGFCLLVIIAIGCLAVLWKPRFTSTVAGVLLVIAACGNAAAALNHPLLIERMDFEHDQRYQLVSMLGQSEDDVLTTTGNGRILGQPIADGHRGDLLRGWSYLLYGYWLALLALAGILVATGGSLGRRITHAALWTTGAIALAVVVCWPRLSAEYDWLRARLFEMRGDFVQARASLDRAAATLGPLTQMERNWLLAGKLDYFADRDSRQELFFRAHQLDPHERPRAKAIMRDLLADAGEIAVRRQYARLLNEAGLSDFHQTTAMHAEDLWRRGQPYFDQPGFYPPRLIAAYDAWEESAAILPVSRDNTHLYLGEASTHNDRWRPERTDGWFAPLLNRLPDRVLRADVQSTLGNAYFEVGDFRQARQFYDASVKSFMLPKIINYRGQKGLGGL